MSFHLYRLQKILFEYSDRKTLFAQLNEHFILVNKDNQRSELKSDYLILYVYIDHMQVFDKADFGFYAFNFSTKSWLEI